MKRWVTTLMTAGLAEFTAHWLSLGWGFMVITAAFVFTAVHVTAGMALATAKAAATEARVAALVPIVNNVNSTANNALPKSGGTITGNLNVNNNLAGSGGGTLEVSSGVHSSGSVQADDQVLAGSANIGGSGSSATLAINGNVHASSAGQFDGGISASNYQPGQGVPSGYPIAHGTPWENQVIDFLNSMVSKLSNAGVY